MTVNGQRFEQGDYVSFDGLSGEVKIGRVPTRPSEILQVLAGELSQRKSDIYGRFSKLLRWADKVRRLGIRANADQPDQAANRLRLRPPAASVSAAPSTCSSARNGSRIVQADDPGRVRGRPAGRARRVAAAAA